MLITLAIYSTTCNHGNSSLQPLLQVVRIRDINPELNQCLTLSLFHVKKLLSLRQADRALIKTVSSRDPCVITPLNDDEHCTLSKEPLHSYQHPLSRLDPQKHVDRFSTTQRELA